MHDRIRYKIRLEDFGTFNIPNKGKILENDKSPKFYERIQKGVNIYSICEWKSRRTKFYG